MSPETKAAIDAYTPSNETTETQDFFGRRRLRIINGQDPENHPEKFTPLPAVVRVADVWPTNEGAYKWAEPGRQKRALYNKRIREEAEQMKKVKTPSGAAGNSTSPKTEDTATAARTSYGGPAMPIQM